MQHYASLHASTKHHVLSALALLARNPGPGCLRQNHPGNLIHHHVLHADALPMHAVNSRHVCHVYS